LFSFSRRFARCDHLRRAGRRHRAARFLREVLARSALDCSPGRT